MVNTFIKAYYQIKPLIPRRLQIAIRRAVARVKLRIHSDVWPIDERAGMPPKDWKGWPGGKRFAFLLTHDVDKAVGQERCLHLADLELELGFTGSYNFVPERYPVREELRRYLAEHGFEVGVHGLNHDGKYYNTYRIFKERSLRINQYMKDWDSVGYRSPSMLHNLEWIHGLNIKYDSSTFDTDPFEPQSDGMRTIFPFWVSAGIGDEGYVELPYTLPQDFTLYILLRQRNIDTWKRKLDWIVSKGGMALLLVHPDYINPGKTRNGNEEYPLKFYSDFLRYIKKEYGGEYYHVLPRDLAKFWKMNYLTPSKIGFNSPNQQADLEKYSGKPTQAKKHEKIRAAMVSYSFYESDGRVRRYAETLARRGDHVDVISLRQAGQDIYSEINGVHVFRIQERERNEKGRISFLGRLIRFFIKSSIYISRQHLKTPYDLIHVHSVPDFEVFASFLPKLLGAKIILDIHDLVPEFYASKFDGGGDSILFKTLVFVEKASGKFADHVIISNHIWEKVLVKRSINKKKCSTFLNYPDPLLFYPRNLRKSGEKVILIYPGSLHWHQGVDVALHAFHSIESKIPEAEFHIYGDGKERGALLTLIQELGLQNRVFIRPYLPLDQIAEVIASADIGVVPKRNDPFGGEAFSTKILEFMSMGVPAIVSRTKIDDHYFDSSVLKFFRPDDISDLADAMLKMIKDRGMRESLAENALNFVKDFSWEKRKEKYLDLVDRLTNRETGDLDQIPATRTP